MPVRTYKDQNNAIIISIMFLSFIFSIIFTSEYYSEQDNYVNKNKIKKYYIISWSIFTSFSFMFIISNINCKHIRNNVSSPKV